ncbi:zf-HC2 domain-containing protein [Solirubrobacter sp. CPCC 204708]|uniref:Zf-HC2 domain-containing protein n=1 Tax=Solirubrobacter deserti TaxID=2282478 RepID=A0ABT4RQQ2_9ACTN|nr:zf-HC2 domain-containing protein [Solirubrobacter deserti]MBE2320681.1 zf-HC2 domain-containing protein [Solirubrobacter deserti]MDA0140906.1 zf-HC2 domain-containing protein [Solirubrobacter deserti]
MIRCREVVELVTDYLDDALPPTRYQDVAAHLQHCDGCHAFVEQIRVTIGLVRRNFTSAMEN